MENVNIDCFAYKNDHGKEFCAALNALYCNDGECKFYKTAEQACHDCTYMDCKGCVNPLADE